MVGWRKKKRMPSYSSFSTSQKGYKQSPVSHLIIGKGGSVKTVAFLLRKAGPPGVCWAPVCQGSSAFAKASLLCCAWRNPAGTADCPHLASAGDSISCWDPADILKAPISPLKQTSVTPCATKYCPSSRTAQTCICLGGDGKSKVYCFSVCSLTIFAIRGFGDWGEEGRKLYFNFIVA